MRDKDFAELRARDEIWEVAALVALPVVLDAVPNTGTTIVDQSYDV
jgi:hypothetical protein